MFAYFGHGFKDELGTSISKEKDIRMLGEALRPKGWQDFLKLLGRSLASAWGEALALTDLWLRFPLMGPTDIRTELNAIRLVGTWSVPIDNGRYVFTLKIENGVYTSFPEICRSPTGEVTDGATIGTWEMPIEPERQRIRGVTGFARRLARGRYGLLQG